MQKEDALRLVGAAIRQKRSILRLSQEGFADEIGMHRAYFSAIERGEKNITIGTLCRIADGLGCRVAELLPDSG